VRCALFAVTVLALCLSRSAAAAAADLAHVERKIVREPRYRGQPRYALAGFGPEARFKVWLVLDGDTLYVDRNGDGDLTGPGERVPARKDSNRGDLFKAGDLTADGEHYTDLEVRVAKLKDY